MEKVNYIITTWSGKRRVPNKRYLKDHLLKLLSLEHKLSQITIVKPVFEGYDSDYYDIEDLISEFDCNVVILEKTTNSGQSYGQFFYAYETFKDEFDYYIFVEDDYMVDIDNFDYLLLNEYKIQNVNGFLCSHSGISEYYPQGGCSVSNGLISTKYMEHIYENNNNPIARLNATEGHICHKNFADLIIECGLFFKCFSHKYRVPYYGTSIIEYGRTDTDESIFIPHQLFDIKLNFRKITLGDLPKFLEIRNESKEYLHNNNTFNLENATEWFNGHNPKFYMIEIGKKIIGYFRTSNWDSYNKTVYIGCDIHSDYRGHGIGYKSYMKFIEKLNNEYVLDAIKLEVLSSNVRAINLYNKLGFKKIGVDENKIIRENIEIESIIMELKK